MKPVVHGLEDRYRDRIDFVYLDVDDPATAELKAQLGFAYQPYFVLVDAGGAVVRSWKGAVAEADFVAAFEALPAP